MRGRPSDSIQTTFDEAIHAFRRIEKDKIRYAEQRKVRFQEEFRRPTQQRFYQGRDRSPSPYRQTDQPRTPWRQNQAQQQYRRDYSPSRAPTKIGPAIPAEATTTIIIIQPTKIGPAKSAEATTTIITIQPTKIGPAETAESTTTIIITQPTKIGQADTAEATTTITTIQPTKIGPAEAAKTTKKISAGILKATNRKSSTSNPTLPSKIKKHTK
ncbi:hypothetical protein ANTRET_LOCUS10892 [Anthophora retusa]